MSCPLRVVGLAAVVIHAVIPRMRNLHQVGPIALGDGRSRGARQSSWPVVWSSCVPFRSRWMDRTSTLSGLTMATPYGTAAATRQAASGYALRALPRRKTYTTSWDINQDHASTGQTSRCHDHLRRPGGDLQCQRLRFSMSARLIDGSFSPSSPASLCPVSCEVRIRSDGHCMRPAAVRRCCIQTCMTDLGAVLRTCPQMADKRRPADGPERQVKENIAVAQARRSALGSRAARQA